MKLYQAIKDIVNEFGKDILTNSKVINIFSDYNAFEESKCFKIIIKNLIVEGYMDQIFYIKDWDLSSQRITENFIAATSFNDSNVTYVINSIGYGLGINPSTPSYNYEAQASTPSQQQSSSHQQQPVRPKQQSTAKPNNIDGSQFNKTESQLDNMGDKARQNYKEGAEKYLESIIQLKSDFSSDLGANVSHNISFDPNCNAFDLYLEIDGKIKVKYDYGIKFCIILYGQNNKILERSEIYAGVKKQSFETCEAYFSADDFGKVCNIQRIVIYWEND